jgi:ankyrin repeat protein
MCHFRNVVLLLVFYTTYCFGGSYEEFFAAIRQDDASAIAALLRRGFDPNSKDPQGQSGLVLALKFRSSRAANALLEHPSTDVNELNETGESALMLAAFRGDHAWTLRLVDRGAAVNLQAWSPLHYAASGPNAKVVELLLDRGANANSDSPNRSTPLMMAARYGTEDSVQALLARGADPRRRNEQGLLAADFARLAGRDALAARLDRLSR